MLLIFDPVTPGALRASIDDKIVSSSSTQDDMVASLRLVSMSTKLTTIAYDKVQSCSFTAEDTTSIFVNVGS